MIWVYYTSKFPTQTDCDLSSANLCKGSIMQQFVATKEQDKVPYAEYED